MDAVYDCHPRITSILQHLPQSYPHNAHLVHRYFGWPSKTRYVWRVVTLGMQSSISQPSHSNLPIIFTRCMVLPIYMLKSPVNGIEWYTPISSRLYEMEEETLLPAPVRLTVRPIAIIHSWIVTALPCSEPPTVWLYLRSCQSINTVATSNLEMAYIDRWRLEIFPPHQIKERSNLRSNLLRRQFTLSNTLQAVNVAPWRILLLILTGATSNFYPVTILILVQIPFCDCKYSLEIVFECI